MTPDVPSELNQWVSFGIALGIAFLVGVFFAILIRLTTKALRHKYPDFVESLSQANKHLMVFVGLVLFQIAVATTWPLQDHRTLVLHILLIATVAAGAAFLTAIVTILLDRIRTKHPITGDEDQDTRRLHTQLSLIKGFANAAIWLIAIGIALFTIPGAEAVGTSLLASAGVASVIAGIAAQSLLGNVFAGIQIAFSGSIRVDDLVVVEAQSGRVEEITLTSVVVKLWDERRLVLPSTYFTTTPFENWTRGSAELLGTIHLDVDWRISPSAARVQLEEILKTEPLWDKRTSGLIVEDATGGMIRIRALVSAANSADLFTLRCSVREKLVEWVASTSQTALPTQRVLSETPTSTDI